MSIKKGAPNEESHNEDMKISMNINKKLPGAFSHEESLYSSVKYLFVQCQRIFPRKKNINVAKKSGE